jgi:hypothetical protein
MLRDNSQNPQKKIKIKFCKLSYTTKNILISKEYIILKVRYEPSERHR